MLCSRTLKAHFSSAVWGWQGFWSLRKFLLDAISVHDDYYIRHYNILVYSVFFFLHFYCRDGMRCTSCDVQSLLCISSVAGVLHISFHDVTRKMQNVRCWLIFAVSARGVVAAIISRYCYCHAAFRLLSCSNLPSLACGSLCAQAGGFITQRCEKVNARPVCGEKFTVVHFVFET